MFDMIGSDSRMTYLTKLRSFIVHVGILAAKKMMIHDMWIERENYADSSILFRISRNDALC
jgi:hypothetical protein